MAKPLGLIVNPTSGKGAGKQVGKSICDELQKAGLEYLDLSAQNLESVTANGRKAIAEKAISGLVVVGGDGMMHLGVNLCAGTEIPLMVVGAGTGNDSARELGMPIKDAAASVSHLVKHLANPRRVDVVKCTNASGERHYFGSVSAGFDAIVNARANKWTWPKGAARYPLALFRELPVFSPIRYKIEVDGQTREIEAMLIAVANASAYGGGMKIAPKASTNDGLLDLFIVHKISRAKLVRLFPKVYSGGHVTDESVEFVRCKKVTLDAQGLPAFADGEPVGHSPLTAEIVPGALLVFA